MIYTKNIKYIEALISDVLNDLQEKSLFDNKNFKILKNKIHDESYVVLELVKLNTINLILWLEVDCLRIDIDRTQEIIVYDADFMKENREDVQNIIKMIFTSFINVKYYGEHHTELEFMDKDYKILEIFTYRDRLFSLKKSLQEKRYQPIF